MKTTAESLEIPENCHIKNYCDLLSPGLYIFQPISEHAYLVLKSGGRLVYPLNQNVDITDQVFKQGGILRRLDPEVVKELRRDDPKSSLYPKYRSTARSASSDGLGFPAARHL